MGHIVLPFTRAHLSRLFVRYRSATTPLFGDPTGCKKGTLALPVSTREPPRNPRAGITAVPTFEDAIYNEDEILDAVISALGRDQLPSDTWVKLHAAAARDQRTAELAFAYEGASQGKLLRTLVPQAMSEFLFHAAEYFAEVMGDEAGSASYLERALDVFPGHEAAFLRLSDHLESKGQIRPLAQLTFSIAAHRARADQVELLRRAAALFEKAGLEERAIEAYQQILRIVPHDGETRELLEGHFLQANRHRDIARLLEQAISAEPKLDSTEELKLRVRLLDLYVHQLKEPERTVPHVEAILAIDPSNDAAARTAQKLLPNKSLAARAAAALADANARMGMPEGASSYLEIELEHTRGPKRRDVLRRIGILKQEKLGDTEGAYAAYEAAITIDPSDNDVRARYAEVAYPLGKSLDASRVLFRALTTAKDSALRAAISCESAQLLRMGGEVKKAKSAFVSVLSMPGASDATLLTSARALAEIYENDNQLSARADMLTRISMLTEDDEERHTTLVLLAELAENVLKDRDRAIFAWERLASTERADEALIALQRLYDTADRALDLANVLSQREAMASDEEMQRGFAFESAEVLTTRTEEVERAIVAWTRFFATYGGDRRAYAHAARLLEGERKWPELASILFEDAKLADDDEKPSIFARLGLVHLTRLRSAGAAIVAFDEALQINPNEVASRENLEKLLSTGDHALAAARVLERVYRFLGVTSGLLRVLDVKAERSETIEERLDSDREAFSLASGERALLSATRGLQRAVESSLGTEEWLERVEAARRSAPEDPKAIARTLSLALGDRAVDSLDLYHLAKRLGELHEESSDSAAALEAYRRALAFAPKDALLLERIDEILRAQGNPEERVALYRTTLAQGVPKEQRKNLLHRIGAIAWHELTDFDGAIGAFAEALEDSPLDVEAYGALSELYSQSGRFDDLLHLLEGHLPLATPEQSRRTRVRIAKVALGVGDKARAYTHVFALVTDPDASLGVLNEIEDVVSSLDDTTLSLPLFERRANESADPHDQMHWLDRLGEMRMARADDPDGAKRAWSDAATIALNLNDDLNAIRLFELVRSVAPNDTEAAAQLIELYERADQFGKLPELATILLASAPPQRALELRILLWKTYETRLDDLSSAMRVALQVLRAQPDDEETLHRCELLSVRASAQNDFFETLDALIASAPTNWARTNLRLSKARAAQSSATLFSTLVATYHDVLNGDEASAEQKEAAVHAFSAALAQTSAEGRATELRWLFQWRIDRADESAKRELLLAWALAEESVVGDTRAALGVAIRLSDLDPENPEAFAAVYRLSLLVDDIDRATRAMARRLELSEGEGKKSLELELARLLVERTSRAEEALASISQVLDSSPSEPEALLLAHRLLSVEGVRADAIQVLERAFESENDARGKASILETLIDGAKTSNAATRLGWYRELLRVSKLQGDPRGARKSALAGASEFASEVWLWEEAEELSRELQDPEPIAKLYTTILASPLAKDVALELGQRAVAFFEEWFEEPGRVIDVLTRMLDIEPADTWAFDRLKLMYDTSERWSELFALFEKTIARSPDTRAIELLEEAAGTAKDFANDLDRAVRYFEELVRLRPQTARFSQSLARLYERSGRYRELANLLETEISNAKDTQKLDLLHRLAEIWAFKLNDATLALSVLDRAHEISATDVAKEPPLLERILELTANVAALVSPRQTAALQLKKIYEDKGDEFNRARMLEVELEATLDDERRLDRYQTLGSLYEGLESYEKAFELFLNAFRLDATHTIGREALVRLARPETQLERLFVELEAAATNTPSPDIAADLFLFAASLREERSNDLDAAAELLSRALALSPVAAPLVARTAKDAERIFEKLNRKREQLNALERLAAVEIDVTGRAKTLQKAAYLATKLGESQRAIDAWRHRLAMLPGDIDSLNGLADRLRELKRWSDLVDVLELRADSNPESRADDRLQIARLLGEELGLADRSIGAWRRVEKEVGPSDQSTGALHSLLSSTARFDELAELLSSAAERSADTQEKGRLLAELGALYAGSLRSPAEAVKSFSESLESDPSSEAARAGLLAFAEDSDLAEGALAALLAAYRQTNDWEKVIRLVDARLLARKDDEGRASILLETAKIAEERLGKRDDAYSFAERALLAAPDSREAHNELHRLSKERSAPADLAASLAKTLDSGARISNEAKQRIGIQLAEVLERELDRLDEALARYSDVNALDRGEPLAAQAVIRTAARAGKWEVAASAFVEAVRKTNSMEDVLIRALMNGAENADAWPAMLSALEQSARPFVDTAPPSLARALITQIAEWQRDKRGDPSQAEKAFEWALSFDPANAELLSALAELQRRTKGRPLVGSLLRLSTATGGDLELLLEAAEIAELGIQDRALALSIYSDMYALAKARWRGDSDHVQTNSPRSVRNYVERSLKSLVALQSEEGRFAEVAALFEEAASLPFDRPLARSFLIEAATLAEAKLNDPERAANIYNALFDEDPHDAKNSEKLVASYTARGQMDALYRLRQKQVSLTDSLAERLMLRIELAKLESTISGVEASFVPLNENLSEDPRHAPTVAELAATLVAANDYKRLEALFVTQAELAEKAADGKEAASFWVEAARVAETSLGDARKAASHLERAVAHGPSATAFDTLARLRVEFSDDRGAADALLRLLALLSGNARIEPVIRLAEARARQGEQPLARQALEEELSRDPELESIRARLTEFFREWGDDLALADLLADGALHAPDKATRLVRLKEAADLYISTGKTPEKAIPLLEQAHDLAPDDRQTSLVLSEALVRTERYEEARKLLRDIIEGFGGRKPKERAPVHVYLAKLELALGDRPQAVSELEAATRIDPSDPEPLRALAELSREDGQLERAERSYRSLLTVLKHKEATPSSARAKRSITRAEVLLELSDIARKLGDAERANEILESALEAAASDPRAREGLELALRERGDFATLAKILADSLLPPVESDLARLTELAHIYEEKLGRADEALRTLLRAIALVPDSEEIHSKASALAEAQHATADYLSTLESASEQASTPATAAALLVRAANVLDSAQEDNRAAALYEKAQRLDPSRGDILLRLERVLRRLGDETRYASTLESLLDAETDGERRRAFGARLALIWIKSNTKLERAGALLAGAVDTFSADELREAIALLESIDDAALDNAFETAARADGGNDLLLRALTRTFDHTPTPALAREAASIAVKLHDKTASRFLDAILEGEPTDDDAIWALTQKADWLASDGSIAEAADLLSRAADLANADQTQTLRLKAATLAESVSDFARSSAEYLKLFEASPESTEIWPALLRSLEALGDADRLRASIAKMAEFTDDSNERTKLEIFSADVAHRKDGDLDAWIRELTEIQSRNTDSNDAIRALGAALIQKGDNAGVRALYAARIEHALTHKDRATHAEFAFELGTLLLTTSHEEALDVFRAAALVGAENRNLLLAYLAALPKDADDEERANALQQLLSLPPAPDDTPAQTEEFALQLAALRAKHWDEEGEITALALGYKKAPESRGLRRELETKYRAKSAWADLVELYTGAAERSEEMAERGLELLRAATVLANHLGEYERALSLADAAAALLPGHPEVDSLRASVLVREGNHDAGFDLYAAVLERANERERPGVLIARARSLAHTEAFESALADWNQAVAASGGNHELIAEFGAFLVNLGEFAARTQNRGLAGAGALRRAEILSLLGDSEGARTALYDLLEVDRENVEVLRALGLVEQRAERWEEAVRIFSSLIPLENVDQIVPTAILLAEAAKNLGRVHEARAGLERARLAAPTNNELRDRLADLYESTGALRELAELSLEEARATSEPAARLPHLIRAGMLLLQYGHDPAGARAALEEAYTLHPTDLDTTAMLSDALAQEGRLDDATTLLQKAIASFKGRRARELSVFHHRLARISEARGDRETAVTQLSTALDMDSQNGVVAAELAYAAMDQQKWEVAIRALRATTMLKQPGPLSRALAYQHLGEIARHQGDERRAATYLRRALDEDPALESARTLLQSLTVR